MKSRFVDSAGRIPADNDLARWENEGGHVERVPETGSPTISRGNDPDRRIVTPHAASPAGSDPRVRLLGDE